MNKPTKDHIKNLLENRHTTTLEWVESWKGLTACGNDILCHLTTSATVHDCVNLGRKRTSYLGHDISQLTDATILADFISVHLCIVKEQS